MTGSKGSIVQKNVGVVSEPTEDAEGYIAKFRMLFLSIVKQAVDDIRAYQRGVEEASRLDYLSSLAFFKHGGGYDEWMKIIDIEDARFEKLREDILAEPVIAPRKVVPFKERKKYEWRGGEKIFTCARCGAQFPNKGNGTIKYCPACRREARLEQQREWRKRQPTLTRKRTDRRLYIPTTKGETNDSTQD